MMAKMIRHQEPLEIDNILHRTVIHPFLKSLSKYEKTYIKSIAFLYLNIRSLRNKLHELQAILALNIDIDCIIITEAWLQPGYEFYYGINNNYKGYS